MDLRKILAFSFFRQGVVQFASALGTHRNSMCIKSNHQLLRTTPARSIGSTSQLLSTSQLSNNQSPIWYSDPNLSRSDIATLNSREIVSSSDNENKNNNTNKFIVLDEGERGVRHLISLSKSRTEGEIAKPFFMPYKQLQSTLGDEITKELLESGELTTEETHASLIWLGHRDGNDDVDDDNDNSQYWAVYFGSKNNVSELFLKDGSISISADTNEPNSKAKEEEEATMKFLPLREFGDRINSQDAAILSVANGLVEFHKSHKFCSTCGSPTIQQKAGASRLCSNSRRNGGSCRAPSIYPRIDVASIMLITSPCENYALLGRKASWPSGRYSTLAGFLEVGETLEECCARETFEESGVSVDTESISFVRSQPWPFPRSLMVGFRARAKSVQSKDSNGSKGVLPEINFDANEMEDVQWFHRDFVAERLEGGSTALLYNPTEEEKAFHIPGRASLARHLITSWAQEN